MPDTNQPIKYLLSILFAALPAMALAGSLGVFNQSPKTSEPSSLGFYGSTNLLPVMATANLNEEPAMGSNNRSSSNVKVTINGQSVNVPQNGSVHQSVPVNDGSGNQTKVDISAHNSSSNGSGNGRSSSSLHIQTNTTSILNTEQTEE